MDILVLRRWQASSAAPDQALLRSRLASAALTASIVRKTLEGLTLIESMASSLGEARRIIEEWRIDYNTNRPHSSLNGLTPTEFATGPDKGQNHNRRLSFSL